MNRAPLNDAQFVKLLLEYLPSVDAILLVTSNHGKVWFQYSTKLFAASHGRRRRASSATQKASDCRPNGGAECGKIEILLEECEQFSPDEREYKHDDEIDAHLLTKFRA